jgi:hypothetical protein
MSKRDWIKYAAFGGLTLVVLVAIGGAIYLPYQEKNAQARNRAAKYDVNTAKPPVVYVCENIGRRRSQCVMQPPESEAVDEHTKADLKAQQDAAQWSLLNVLLTCISIVLSAAAVAFTGWAALAAAKAARAADAAVDLAREISADETRAYVSVVAAELYWSNPDGSDPYIMLKCVNRGQTPAKFIEVRAKTFVTLPVANAYERLNKSFSDVDLADPTERCATALGGGDNQLYLGCTSESDKSALQASFKQRVAINIAGVIRYETIFHEIAETEFWFYGENVTHFAIVPPSNPANNQRLIARFLSTREQPHTLTMAQGIFRTYDIVQKPNE